MWGAHRGPVLSQYTLSQETIEALKKPTFDVWHWEHNEVSAPPPPSLRELCRRVLRPGLQMLSCLEYMYHDLGLVKEFNMNPITLKRWLVTDAGGTRCSSEGNTLTSRRPFLFQLAIQENYRNNPFHNFRHCFCVSQMMYGMIHLCNLQVSLQQGAPAAACRGRGVSGLF